ncbi:MAG: PASTA domain-containing protein, partial [Ruminococcaceae bacterium]|nr:PASTA domain-containing protein [Oscillospiraceae bacterium]
DSDGDSTSYAGYDIQFGRKIEVREFLPANGCSRNRKTGQLLAKTGAELHYKTSLMDFCDLFKNLVKLNYEDGIVKVLEFFEQNNTAYAIMEDFDGIPLKDFISLKNGVLDWEECYTIMQPIFSALISIHSVNLTHRGVSPETIFVSRDGKVKLSGFATTSVRTKGTDVAAKLFAGYSAPEQYSTTSWHTIATDVYGLSATIYRCITGTTPQEADHRKVYDNISEPIKLNSSIPPFASKSLMLGLLIDQNERIGTINELKQRLSNHELNQSRNKKHEESIKPATAPEQQLNIIEAEIKEESGSKGEKVVKTVLITAISLFVLMLLVYFVYSGIRNKIPTKNDGELTGQQESPLVVPNYAGMMIDEASLNFDVVRFSYVIEDVYIGEEPEGMVINQQPINNSTAKKGDTITLFVNRAKYVEMIDFSGLTKENAELLLTDMGMDPASYEFKSEETTKGSNQTVFKQSVEPGVMFNSSSEKLILTLAVRTDLYQ